MLVQWLRFSSGLATLLLLYVAIVITIVAVIIVTFLGLATTLLLCAEPQS